jgi:hypothetical protein
MFRGTHFSFMQNASGPVLPELFSTATQFLERQSIASHIVLLDKKKAVLKSKTYFYLLVNIILQKTQSISHNETCVIDAYVSGCRLPIFAVVVVESLIRIIY